ncbi:AraC family transcriptional regulator [Methylomonas sp. UP202]|uniref:AraC family transcriptional regulator n=1 Tax=Methylomonas sp. UP202 TaxID=3040943 RepID=UPI00247AF65E|nr:AraC family transcriptional regulator [Methylomonas sp. UP202]WGS83883.1 AraC family transcriptional regulator [Methylomonas sp. UP202]
MAKLAKQSNAYQDRMERVCDYIRANLDDDLSVDRLCRIALFSKYHFHRQFSEYTGVNVFRFIQLTRLKRACYQLAYRQDLRIIDIAFEAKFENPESFARAFKKLFGQKPSQFRKQPQWQLWHQNYRLPAQRGKTDMQIEIVEFEQTKVAVLEHRGPVETLNDSIAVFIEWRRASGLSPKSTSNTYGLAYDDPETTAPENFRFDLCGSVEQDVPHNPQGVVTKTIPGGRCAVIHHVGPHEVMDDKIRFLYGTWLPESNEELRDFPCFFHYLNLFPDVPENELITDIYLPLKDA